MCSVTAVLCPASAGALGQLHVTVRRSRDKPSETVQPGCTIIWAIETRNLNSGTRSGTAVARSIRGGSQYGDGGTSGKIFRGLEAVEPYSNVNGLIPRESWLRIAKPVLNVAGLGWFGKENSVPNLCKQLHYGSEDRSYYAGSSATRHPGNPCEVTLGG